MKNENSKNINKEVSLKLDVTQATTPYDITEKIRIPPYPKVIKIKEREFLQLNKGDIIGKDLNNPEWIEEVWIGDKVFYVVSKKMIDKLCDW